MEYKHVKFRSDSITSQELTLQSALNDNMCTKQISMSAMLFFSYYRHICIHVYPPELDKLISECG